jgi:succinate dehydrogenase / fumarate reductase, cytochrome b subunit
MWALTLYRSTIGKKIIMAVTGLVLVVFVIGHMAGNLQQFMGPARMNAYAAFLKSTGELIWIARLTLLAATILHVLMAWQLTQIKRAARPVGYAKREPQVSTLASRTMRWGGVFLLVFIVFHILHFTTETIDPGGWRGMTDLAGHRDVYGDIVASFRIWWVALFYVVSMLALGLHLYHGAWSSVRTLGYAKPSFHPLHRRIALVVATVVWLGFTLVPLGVIAGIIR